MPRPEFGHDVGGVPPPPEIVDKPLKETQILLQEWAARIRQTYGRFVTRHGLTHRPGAYDSLDYSGNPGLVGIVSAQGPGRGISLNGHVHRLGIVTTKGDLLGHNGTDPVRIPGGVAGTVPMQDPDDALGIVQRSFRWRTWRRI